MALSNSMRVVFDAAAVLIAVAALGVLAVGPRVGAGAMVLILGSTGVAGVSAAGVLLTARPARSVRLPGAAGRSPTVSGRNEETRLRRRPSGTVRKAPAPT
jgi:hypothetical protein